MAKYMYPAIITVEEDGYSAHFPDIEGCYTSALTFSKIMERAKDVLCLMLYDMEQSNKKIPRPSKAAKSDDKDGECCLVVCCDTADYAQWEKSRNKKGRTQ